MRRKILLLLVMVYVPKGKNNWDNISSNSSQGQMKNGSCVILYWSSLGNCLLCMEVTGHRLQKHSWGTGYRGSFHPERKLLLLTLNFRCTWTSHQCVSFPIFNTPSLSKRKLFSILAQIIHRCGNAMYENGKKKSIERGNVHNITKNNQKNNNFSLSQFSIFSFKGSVCNFQKILY